MKHLINVADLSSEEVKQIFKLAQDIRSNGSDCLNQKSVGLLFEKPSNRTRLSFEVGVSKLGGRPLYIKGDEVQIGSREPASHVSRVMSRYLDMIMYRTTDHNTLVEFSKYANMPVINGLSDVSHPCQAFADALTILDNFGSFDDVFLTYIGDGNNVCQSLMEMAELAGFKMAVVCPKKYAPKSVPKSVIVAESIDDVIAKTSVIYTDVWVSMGDEDQSVQRVNDFKHYQVTESVIKKALPNCIFLHCLPANLGQEVTESVFESSQSKVFDQAENRLHAQNGIMAWLINQ
jgi:ornithine carbamoyltransferase